MAAHKQLVLCHGIRFGKKSLTFQKTEKSTSPGKKSKPHGRGKVMIQEERTQLHHVEVMWDGWTRKQWGKNKQVRK